MAAASALLAVWLPACAQQTGPVQTLPARLLRAERFLAQRSLQASPDAAALAMRARRQDSALRRRQHAEDATSGAATWTQPGPQQVSTKAYGLVTGRITSIAVDPHDPTGNTIYVGATGGGVWRSTNAAGSSGAVGFSPLTDAIPAYTDASTASLSIGALTVQPGGTGVILAGTGDPNDALDSYYGSGILRSDDGGNNWSLITRSNDALNGGFRNNSFLGLGFSGFAWSTTAPGTVVAAVSDAVEGDIVNAAVDGYSTTGLYYSTDSGQTWYMATIQDGSGQIIQSPNYELYSGGNAATSVVWNPIRNRFYAAVRFHGYYDSPDGVTWTRLANQPGTTLTQQLCPTNPGLPASTSCPLYRGTVAVQPVTGDLFTLTVDLNNQDQGLYRDICSPSGACSSTAVQFQQQIDSTVLEAGSGDPTIPQGDYDLTLAAVPSQQDTLLFAGTQDVYRASMANSFAWRNTTNVNTCAAATVAPSNHAIDGTFSANGLMYFGTDGGLWRTTDDVDQTQPACSSDDAAHFQNLNTGLGSLAEINSFSGDPSDAATLLAGLGELGTAGSASGRQAWAQVLDGEGSHTAIDPVHPQNWYASSGPGVSINLCTDGAACTQQGFGNPLIQSSQVGSDGDQLLLPAVWMLDPQNTANVIVGTCRVWRGSGSSGAMLDPLSSMLDGDQQPSCNGNAQIQSLAASGSVTDPPGTPERLYAGIAGAYNGGAPVSGAGGSVPGHVFVTQVSSLTTTPVGWSDLAAQPVSNLDNGNGLFNPGGFGISSIYVDPHDATGQTVYVTVAGFDNNGQGGPVVYRSTDGGVHWFSLMSDLPDAPANSIAVDPNDANTVYIALDTGVYLTRNVASCTDITQDCWTSFGSALPKSPVTSLRIFQQGSTSVLQAATYGRGIWQVPLATAGQALTTAVFTGPQALTFPGQPVNTSSSQQTLTITNTGQVSLTVTNVTVSGEFTEQDDCTGAPITPQGTCTVQVTFAPVFPTGTDTGALTVYANVSGGQLTASLTGAGIPPPAIELLPASLNFGSFTNGATSPVQNVTVSNIGGKPVNLQAPKITGDFAITANTCGSSLQPNYGCTVGITFSPSTSGARSGVFSITDDVGTQTTQLSGTGLAPATDTLSTQALTFAPLTIGGKSAPQTITLTNTGGVALTEISVPSRAGDFSAVNNCGPILAGGQSCSISVFYTPESVGPETATLTITDILRSQTITLVGSGVAPLGIVSAEPRQIDFGSQGVGSTSSPQTVTLTNNGGAMVPLTGLYYSVAGNFSLQSSSVQNPCTDTLAYGASCALAVVFTPSQPGPLAGSLTIGGGNLTAPLTAALSGVGEDFTLSAMGNPIVVVTSGQTATWQFQLVPVTGSTGTVSFVCSGAPANSLCSTNPAGLTLQSGVTGFITLTVATGTATAASSGKKDIWPGTALALACLLPVFFIPLCPNRGRRIWMVAVTSAALALLPTACGVSSSGGSSTSPPGSTAGSTAAGTYTITLIGSVPGVQHAAAVTLIVQ